MNTFLRPWPTAVLLLVLPALPVAAQNELDALRYSQVQSTGTSRTQAMGGAASSLGADLGAFVLNPANLGAFRRSEFSVSPGLLLTNSASTVAGYKEATEVDRAVLNFGNLGFVLAARRADDDVSSDWRSGNLGINFSRLNTFSANRTYQATLAPDDTTSVPYWLRSQFFSGNGLNPADNQSPNATTRFNYLTALTNRANALDDNFVAQTASDFDDLAYQTYLLNFATVSPTNNQLTGRVYNASRTGAVTQREITEIRGAQNQIDIGYGASYKDKLYLGASLGITTLRYKQTRTLKETTADPTSDLQTITMTDGYEVNGGGLNVRIGAVYKPLDALRLGLSVQTPTWYGQLKEQGQAMRLSTTFSQGDIRAASASTAANAYQYAVTTPFRATAGVTLIGGKVGLVTADADYVNYGSASLSTANDDPGDFTTANNAIRDSYRSVLNYRVGGELRLAQIFRLRAGYAFYASPYTNTDTKGERTVISGGAGIRRENFYLELGLARTEFEQPYSPYSLGSRPGPVVNTKYTLWNPTVTMGFVIQ